MKSAHGVFSCLDFCGRTTIDTHGPSSSSIILLCLSFLHIYLIILASYLPYCGV